MMDKYDDMTQDELGRLYYARIGYNPFDDDPTVEECEVAEWLREWDDDECSKTSQRRA